MVSTNQVDFFAANLLADFARMFNLSVLAIRHGSAKITNMNQHVAFANLAIQRLQKVGVHCGHIREGSFKQGECVGIAKMGVARNPDRLRHANRLTQGSRGHARPVATNSL